MSETASPQKNPSIPDNNDFESPAKPSPGKQTSSPLLKPKPTPSDVNLKSTFMTGTNINGKKGYDDKGQKMDDVYNYHDKLNGVIDQLGSTVRALLSDSQSHFLMAYKEQMIIIQKELNTLRKKIDEETYKRKNDERMNILEQERDWFRAEAIRLDKICKEQQKVIHELKSKMRIIHDDKTYFEEFVLTAKKENKALKEELMQLELGKTNGEEFPQIFAQTKTLKKNQSFDGGSRRSKTPLRNHEVHADERTEAIRSEYIQLKETLSQQMNEERLLEIIKQLKTELDKERKHSRQLRNEKSQFVLRRIEFEQILVECINETKKEISRRRNTKSYKDLSKGPQIPQDIDITKFSATDKRNLLEFFLSNEVVLEEMYNMVFNPPPVAHHVPTHSDPEKNQNFATSNHPSTKSEGKVKYSFNYGFGSASNLRVGTKDISNASVSQKAQSLMGELKRPEIKKIEPIRREL